MLSVKQFLILVVSVYFNVALPPGVLSQEPAQQHKGFGSGVGESQGVGNRSRVMDADDMLRYQSAPETIMGEVVAINNATGTLLVDMGGSSHDERQTHRGGLNIMTLYFDNQSDISLLKGNKVGDVCNFELSKDSKTIVRIISCKTDPCKFVKCRMGRGDNPSVSDPSKSKPYGYEEISP